jgi:hypothetical protein
MKTLPKHSNKTPKPPPLSLVHRVYKQQKSERAAARALKRQGFKISRSSINRMLSGKVSQLGPASAKSTGDGKKINARTRRWLVRQVIVHRTPTPRQVMADLRSVGISVCRQSVWRALRSDPNLVARRPRTGMFLTKQHRLDRKRWAKTHLTDKTNWDKAVFTDEKLWYLDGPAVRPKVWQDKRLPPLRIAHKGQRNQAVWAWGAFHAGKVLDLCFVPAHYNSTQYCDMLKECYLPHVPVKRYTLYHDRLPAHRSAATAQWLSDQKVKVEHLPARAADINPIENLWGIVTREVYSGTTTYTSVESLKAAILASWAGIQQKRGLRRKLVGSMPDRLTEVVAKKGDWIAY